MAKEKKKIKKTLNKYINKKVDNTQIAKSLLIKIYNHMTYANFKEPDTLVSLDDGSLWLISKVRVNKKNKSML